MLKDLYDIGEIPPLGHVPEHACLGDPQGAARARPRNPMQIEVVPTWPLDAMKCWSCDGGAA